MSDIVLFDSQTTWQGGMQAGFDPSLVADHQYHKGVNVCCRDGIITTRPSFSEIKLDYSELLSEAVTQKDIEDRDEALASYNASVETLSELYAEKGTLVSANDSLENEIYDIDDELDIKIPNRETEAQRYGTTGWIDPVNDAKFGSNAYLYDDYTALPGDKMAALIAGWDSMVDSMRIDKPETTTQCPDYVSSETGSVSDDSWWDHSQEQFTGSCNYAGFLKYHDSSLPDEPTSIYSLYTYLENKKANAQAQKAANDVRIAELNTEIATEETARDGYYSTYTTLDTAIGDSDKYAWIFENGKFQGGSLFYQSGTLIYFMCVSGIVYKVNVATGKINAMTLLTDCFNDLVDRVYFCQAEQWMVVQDGITPPKVFTTSGHYDLDIGKDSIPVGKHMAYGHGRLFVQKTSRMVVAGDIYKAYKPDNIFYFTETDILNEGGGFTVPPMLGDIKGITFVTVEDSSTGDGPLLLLCENGFSSLAVNNIRANWSRVPMQKVQLIGNGVVGDDCYIRVGEDLIFRTNEGVRSYASARAESKGKYYYTEMSKEVEPYIVDDDCYDIFFGSMAYFDKRMLFTTRSETVKAKRDGYDDAFQAYRNAVSAYEADPSETNAALVESTREAMLGLQVDNVVFNGIIAFDFSLTGYIKSTSDSQYVRSHSGSYDGIWTGLKFLQITSKYNMSNACVIAAKKDGKNCIYVLTKNQSGFDGETPIQCKVETAAYPYKTADSYVDSPFVHKRIEDISLWVDHIGGKTPVKVSVRPDHSNKYIDMGSMEFCAVRRSSSPMAVGALKSRGLVSFRKMKDIYIEDDIIPAMNGNSFQIKLKWEGMLSIRHLLTAARKIANPVNDPVDETCNTVQFELEDDFEYSA